LRFSNSKETPRKIPKSSSCLLYCSYTCQPEFYKSSQQVPNCSSNAPYYQHTLYSEHKNKLRNHIFRFVTMAANDISPRIIPTAFCIDLFHQQTRSHVTSDMWGSATNCTENLLATNRFVTFSKPTISTGANLLLVAKNQLHRIQADIISKNALHFRIFFFECKFQLIFSFNHKFNFLFSPSQSQSIHSSNYRPKSVFCPKTQTFS